MATKKPPVGESGDLNTELAQRSVNRKKETYALSTDAMMQAKQDEVVRIMKNLQERLKVRGKPKFDSPAEMALLIEQYFEDCITYQQFPTKRGLALALGTTYSTLWDWENGRRGSDYSDVIKKASEFLAEMDEQLVLSGIENPVLFMFRSKNYHGLTDKQEMVLTPNTPLGQAQSPEDITKKYALGLGSDSDSER